MSINLMEFLTSNIVDKFKLFKHLTFMLRSADRLKSHRSYLWVLTNLTAYVATLYVVAISLNWIHVQPFLFTSGK